MRGEKGWQRLPASEERVQSSCVSGDQFLSVSDAAMWPARRNATKMKYRDEVDAEEETGPAVEGLEAGATSRWKVRSDSRVDQ